MADALVSTPVALTAGVVAAALIAVAGREVKKNRKEDLIPLMGVTGAFIFAAQMVNFTIPGTGSSGHIIGGVLLSTLLGPWSGFLTLVSVLIIQCLMFADGGLLALGCNILNMGACTCLIAYPLLFKPLMRFPASPWRLMGVSVLACVVGLELGAVGVVTETELSGVTALPFRAFLALMGGIHLLIGIGEGLATGAVLIFIQNARPSLLQPDWEATSGKENSKQWKIGRIIAAFAIGTVILGGVLAFFASTHPDGLEWSIEKLTGSTELVQDASSLASGAEKVRSHTAVMPDYDNSLSGIVGALVVLALVWAGGSLITSRRKETKGNNP